jgi:hypothetical protein
LPQAGALKPYLLDTLANLYYKDGKIEEAKLTLRQALDLKPQDARLAAQLIETKKRLGL